MTRDNNNIILYLNGAQHLSDSCHYVVAFNHDSLNLGRDPSWDEEYFEGIMDDIRIYNRALDSTEVKAVYNEFIAGIELLDNSKTINIYPNPANGLFIINSANYYNQSGYHMEIINPLGQIVLTKLINQSELQINTNEIGRDGIYIIRIFNDNGELKETGKLIVR
jgi:hypothetical protein